MTRQRNMQADGLVIRPACCDDLEAIRIIYNHYIITSVCTMDTEEKSHEEMLSWLESHTPRFPAVVGILNGKIVGIASLSRWADRKGYYPSCEISIYLSPDREAQGHGQTLLQYLIKNARESGFKTIISFVTSINKLARNLARKNNFTFIGTMRQVGCKFNRVIDLDVYQIILSS